MNRKGIPEINPYLCDQLIYVKGGENMDWGKGSLFDKQCWESWIFTYKIMKIGSYLTPLTKTNSK